MIVVTAPTGQIGRQVVSNLLATDTRVRVVARDTNKLSADVRDRVEIVEGSHGDRAVVERAFDGAESVFWLKPPDPKAASLLGAYVGFTGPACEVLKRGGARRVVNISALGRGTPLAGRAGLVTASLAMDDALAATGVPLRVLAMPSFMENTLRQVASLRDNGVFFGPLDPDRKAPLTATRDMAAKATELLLTDWTGQAVVPVLGPEDLSPDDMAGVLSGVLGKPIRYQQVSFDAFESQSRAGGMSEAFVQGYVEMMRAKNEGLDNAEPRTAATSSPTSFHQWCVTVLKPAVEAS